MSLVFQKTVKSEYIWMLAYLGAIHISHDQFWTLPGPPPKNDLFGKHPTPPYFDRTILEWNYPSYYAHTMQDLRVLAHVRSSVEVLSLKTF